MVNAFRTVDPVIFSDVIFSDFITKEFKKAINFFLKVNLGSKELQEAKKILKSRKNKKKTGMFPAQSYHPQRIFLEKFGFSSEKEDQIMDKNDYFFWF